MSRDTNKIKRLTLFDSCDLTAAEEYFAKMAEEGWMINKYSLFSEFVRCEPRSLRFSVQLILPEKQSPEYSEKVRGYTELCEQAGWKLAASKGGMFIFASEDPDIPEVVTDPEERIEAATRQSRIGLFVIWFVVLASIFPVLGLIGNLAGGVGIASQLSYEIPISMVWIACLIMAVTKTALFTKWRRDAKRASSEGSTIKYYDTADLKRRRIVYCIFFILLAASIAVMTVSLLVTK